MKLGLLAVLGACGSNAAPPAAPDAAPMGPAAFAVSPAMGAFGMVGVGADSLPIEFKVMNKGADPATSVVVATIEPFHVLASTCGTMLAGGETCLVEVNVEPSLAGALMQQLDVTSSSATTMQLPLTATAVNQIDVLSLAPVEYSFGAVAAGQKSATLMVSATNEGTVAFGGITIAISGDNPTEFLLSDNKCSGGVVQAATACTFVVVFAPTTKGAKSATFTISTASGGPSTFLATATGS